LTGPSGFSESEIKDAAAFNSLVESGMKPDDAIASVVDSKIPMNKEIRESRAKFIDKELDELSDSAIESNFKTGLFQMFNTPLSGAMAEEFRTDYRNVYRDSYMRFGDAKTAEAAANAAVQTRGGVSMVTGKKQVMKFAPESYYAPGGMSLEDRAKYLRPQLLEAAREAGVINTTGMTYTELDIIPTIRSKRLTKADKAQYEENYILSKSELKPTPDSQQRINAGLKPVYNMWYRRSDGAYDVARDDNNRVRVLSFDAERVQKEYAKEVGEDRVNAKPTFYNFKTGAF
jgi:hypothetical protein